jgi:hypothetical protein
MTVSTSKAKQIKSWLADHGETYPVAIDDNGSGQITIDDDGEDGSSYEAGQAIAKKFGVKVVGESKQTQEGGPGSGPQKGGKKFSSDVIKKAYGILNDPRYKQGNYSGAAKTINKLAPGLADHPDVKNALKRANESIEEKSTEDKLKKWGPVKQLPPIKLPLKFGKPEKVGVKSSYGEDHDCEHEHPGVSHESWKSKEKKEMKQESRKYHDTKPGSIQDTVAQMYANEQKGVTIKVKELSELIETYLNKGGVSHNLSPVIAEKKLEEVLPLQAVREFIGTYNRHFLTNYKAEEFIVSEG